MIMKEVTTVNWGQLPIGDVQLAGIVLLGGETGAGKSSFIDAVIGVMTGNELRFAKYNSAQSETSSSKKTKRTIASYVLGADDSAEPHRQHGGFQEVHVLPSEPGWAVDVERLREVQAAMFGAERAEDGAEH